MSVESSFDAAASPPIGIADAVDATRLTPPRAVAAIRATLKTCIGPFSFSATTTLYPRKSSHKNRQEYEGAVYPVFRFGDSCIAMQQRDRGDVRLTRRGRAPEIARAARSKRTAIPGRIPMRFRA